jgi:hypothetical protein
MRRLRSFAAIVTSIVCAFAAVVVLQAEPRRKAKSAEKPFHADLLKLAAEYQEFGRVDDEERLAPIFCREPRRAVLRLSKSEEADTHGRKLYYLYAKDRAAYLDIAKKSVKPGQAIIKQSWHAETADDERANAPNAAQNAHRYRAGKQGPLFIMYKLDADTPETDKGWVYGTLSSDGKHVTSAGRVASCMACHQDAPHDRLFGLQQD